MSEAIYKVTIVILALAGVLLQFGMILGVAYVLYYLFSLPRRRLERAMVCLHVVDAGLRKGMTPEETVKRAAACGDDSLSIRFQLAAGWILRGLTWTEALRKVPRLLPPNITEIVLLSDKLGGWEKIYPLCRRQLQDVLSQLRATQSCLSPSLLILPLPTMVVIAMVAKVIMPKYRVIAAEFETGFSSLSAWVMEGAIPLHLWIMILGVIPLVILFLHAAGPRLWSFRLLTGVTGDRLDWAIPWHKKRLQRDFAALLGHLLDAGVAEPEAVELAAKGTANAVVQGKAAGVKQALARGESLPQALSMVDGTGEFQWRFQQAAEGGVPFADALKGWCDALQARADQMQQTAMHLGAVLLLLLNGSLVTLIAVDVFGMLIRITEGALQ